MPTLRAEHLVKTYKGRTVVNDVSIIIEPGEIVGLLGPNGAGKTTSFYMMVGLVKPEKGRVLLDSEDITRLPMFRRAHKGIGYLAQENSVFRKLTAAENIMLVLEMQPKMSRAQRRERCDSLIESLDLTTVRNNIAQTLSGGERRRVEIARVLATEPKFILLDEPFTGVDPIQKEELSRLIGTLKQRQIGVLITDHDVLFTLAITDRAYILSEGEVKTSGSTKEIVDDPLAQKYYLGETITSRLKTSTMGYVCDTCGAICSAEEARANHFAHDLDGGTLVPITNNSQTRGLAKSETA